ncbi:hypothetical protein LTR08_007230 [Meristemomyces frigidus]|nr:hypothetical protein LTR08_007230 [Meristemomyces frigidus]
MRIIRDVLDNSIVLTPNFPPPGVGEPQVLECGVGKGAWVDMLLEEYPDCEVTGVDIYFGKGEDDEEEDDDSEEEGVREWEKYRWNMNARFRDDRSDSRLRREYFDLINSRMLMDGINTTRWPDYIKELWVLLKPGGWLQMVELELKFQTDSGIVGYDNSQPLFLWQQWYYHAMGQLGKDPRVGERLGAFVMQAGFQNVGTSSRRLQIGRWNESEPFERKAVSYYVLADLFVSICIIGSRH